MPLMINSNGKPYRITKLQRLLNDHTLKNLAYMFSMVNSFDKATAEALDKLAGVYGVERHDSEKDSALEDRVKR